MRQIRKVGEKKAKITIGLGLGFNLIICNVSVNIRK